MFDNLLVIDSGVNNRGSIYFFRGGVKNIRLILSCENDKIEFYYA